MKYRQSGFTLIEIMVLDAGNSIPLSIFSLNQLVG
jgi:type II secretory pathway component PulJ